MEKEIRVSALIVPILMLTFACLYGWSNRSVPAGDMRFAFPLTIGLGLLSLILILGIFTRRVGVGPKLTAKRLRRPMVLFLCTFILILLAPWDFPIAAALFLGVATPLLGYLKPSIIIPVALILPLALFFGFTALGVPLTSFWLGS